MVRSGLAARRSAQCNLERDCSSRWRQILGEGAPQLGGNSQAERIAVLATMAGGLHCADAARSGLIPHADGDTRRRALVLTDGPLGEGATGPAQFIPALQPDLLGEWFVLRAIANCLPGEELLNLAWKQGPKQTAAFLQRLSQDFPKHEITKELLEVEPPNDQARKAFGDVASSVLVYLHHASCPITGPVIRALIAAAYDGNGLAMNSLGVCYQGGLGVEQNLPEAVEWYRKGAAAGIGLAMTNLGACYQQGLGVEQNLLEAVEWYHKGSATGEKQAERKLSALRTAEALGWPERKPDQASYLWASERAACLGKLPWVTPPPIRAQWEDLTSSAATEVIVRLRPELVSMGLVDQLESLDVQRIRSTPLSFYKNCNLVDLQLRRSDEDSVRFVSALVTQTGAALLDGKPDILQSVNLYLLALPSDEVASAYLRFFCMFVHGTEGPFQIIDDVHDLPIQAAQVIESNLTAHEAISPLHKIETVPENDGWRQFAGCVLYGNALFQATFKVWSSGVVEMMDDQPIVADLPVQAPRFDGVFRMHS